jgi:uroporphyrinogen decarboxylase
LADVGALEMPDPHRAHPLPELLEATRRVVEAIGDRVCVMGRADQGPFSLASMLRGQAAFLMDLALGQEADRIHALLDFCRQVVTRYALAQADQGAHCTSIGESLAGPDVVSPAMYTAYALPYDRQMARDLRRARVPLAYHICGDITPIAGRMLDVGAAVIEFDHKADPAAVKALARGRACLLGPVEPAVMARGTPQQVEELCRQAIEVLAPGGGFILGPGCALPPDTPPGNVQVMVEAAKKYGAYEILGQDRRA